MGRVCALCLSGSVVDKVEDIVGEWSCLTLLHWRDASTLLDLRYE